ncbi:MAG: diacylglycerol kinase family protein [Chloroflexota bacterium]
MRICFIVNPVSGIGNFQKLVGKAIDHLDEQGHEVQRVETQAAGDATQLAQTAANDYFDTVVAVGGDGTINEVCNGLAGTDTALAVFPAGTANVYAAEMRIPIWSPLKPDAVLKAAKIVTDGQRRRIDLGRLYLPDGTSRYFLMWAGIGLDAAINQEERDRSKKNKSLSYASWIVSGFLTAFDFMGTPATLVLDSQVVKERVIMAVVSNGQLYGRVWRMAPKAKMDDGLLDIGMMTGHRWPATLRQSIGITLKQHVRDPKFHLYRTQRLILSATDPLPVHVDAETIGTTPIEIEVAPSALAVVIPQNAPKQLFLTHNTTSST